MSGELINPNWHVALIHYPLGLLMIGVIVELFALVWPAHKVRAGARWMILIGTLSVIPTAMAGLYALRDVQIPGPVSPELRWTEVLARSQLGPEAWDFLTKHLTANLVAGTCFLLVAFVWLASSDLWRKRLYWPFLLVLIAGLAFTGIGAWHGGEAVYRFGVGVNASIAASVAPEGVTEGSAVGIRPPGQTLAAYVLPPLQMHMILASMVFPFVIVGLALTIRRWNEPATSVFDERVEHPAAVTLAFQRRWWYLALAAALLAALAADWSFMGVPTAEAFRENLEHLRAHARLLVHVVFGVMIILLLLVMGLTIRSARHRAGLFAILIVLLFLASAIQIWLGALMLFDSHSGSLFAIGG